MEESTTDIDCVFCQRIFMGDYGIESLRWDCVAFEPLSPVTDGHLLIVPKTHASNAMVDPSGAGKALIFATMIAQHREIQANFITSAGPDASQTVMHTHIHLVPRNPDDGLILPWTSQKEES